MSEEDRLFEDVVADIVRRYEERTPASRAAFERARASLPGGDTRAVTFFRLYPLTIARGVGARVIDADDDECLDVVNCMSAMIHGHAHPVIQNAVIASLELLDDGAITRLNRLGDRSACGVLALILAGASAVPRCMIALSTAMDERDIDEGLTASQAAIEVLLPALSRADEAQAEVAHR